MAGHNKWSKIKRTKGVLDVKRGKIFSKLAKEITVAAKSGGADPDTNARLRSAILAARAENMPGDNIDRAVKRGSGELQGELIEEIVYEGYGPGGVAVMVEVATDNRNRAAQDVRTIFSKHEGALAASGSVAYQFHRKGRISIPLDSVTEDRLMEIALEAGADELTIEDDHHLLLTPAGQFAAVLDELKKAGVNPSAASLAFIPQNTVQISDQHLAERILHLCETLEDNDDVQSVHANFDISEDVLNRLSAA
jgi:YebC/PmpR family DNA-binding regulatory protein